MYLYKVGTQSSVLIKQGVLISEVIFNKRGFTVSSTIQAVACLSHTSRLADHTNICFR